MHKGVYTLITVKITREENAKHFGVAVGSAVDVTLDDYVANVVASEIGNSHIEACKAQAVAARTFAVSKGVLDGKTISDSSATDQAYRATRVPSGLYPNAQAGAQATTGEILTFNGKAINAVYSSNNGGRTVSSADRWGGARPYLIEQDDPWDNAVIRTGHGVGMSQRGAKAMAAAGKTYKEILSFYYPGTVLTQIEPEQQPAPAAITPEPEKEPTEEKGVVGMVTAKAFIDKVKYPLEQGWGYIYGTWGSIWTKAKQDSATREMTVTYGGKWIGKYVTDCSGLLRWALKQLGEEIVHHARYQYTQYCTKKGQLINGHKEDGTVPLPGTAVFLKGSEAHIHHVGVYIGGDTVVEAKGTIYGVVTSHLNHWDYWGELKMVDYSHAAELETEDMAIHEDTQEDATAGTIVMATVSNPNRWLNVRSAASGTAPVSYRAEKGSIVEVLDGGEPDWWLIRYNGKTGWASAQFLTPIERIGPKPVTPEPEVPEGTPVLPDESDTEKPISIKDIDELLKAVREIAAAVNKLENIITTFKGD